MHIRTEAILLAATVFAAGPAFAQSGGGARAGANKAPATGQSQIITNENPQGPGAPLYLSPSFVRQLKQALNAKGYDAGAVNGVWDKQAQNAMRHYQQAAGLEPTGTIDLRSLASLGMPVGSGEFSAFGSGNQNQVITNEAPGGGNAGGAGAAGTGAGGANNAGGNNAGGNNAGGNNAGGNNAGGNNNNNSNRGHGWFH